MFQFTPLIEFNYVLFPYQLGKCAKNSLNSLEETTISDEDEYIVATKTVYKKRKKYLGMRDVRLQTFELQNIFIYIKKDPEQTRIFLQSILETTHASMLPTPSINTVRFVIRATVKQ